MGHFTYLGSIISNDATVSKDLDNRLPKASSFLGRLSKRVWQNYSLRLSTKIQAYRAVIISILLYGAETWVLYWKEIRLLEQFHQCCLHSILGIKWQDHVSNKEVLQTASLPSMQSILLQVQLCWAGHVARREDVHMPKAVVFSELQEGKRDHGAPRKLYKDQLKRQLVQVGISHQSWQQEASDQDRWCSSVRKVSHKFEAERHKAAKEGRKKQKEQAPSQLSSAKNFTCPKCSWVCTSTFRKSLSVWDQPSSSVLQSNEVQAVIFI